ncbi:LysR substrate-binding domain-containing protein [Cellulomonas sp. PhB143]|uniref:LysR substrate-binding domain-containing protein n=1 Tax=Cellulomonas sp. PhB143 TaxID=2485186 RepID=UPI0018F527E7|nr:LysR substrate-binding domain-containing protein [Cellulomonas sp. PhB143]
MTDTSASDPTTDDGDQGSAHGSTAGLRLGYVPGATPAKWASVWRERLPREPLTLVPVEAAQAHAALLSGEIDAALARLPVGRDVLSAIALYEEVAVVVVGREHAVAALEEDEPVDPGDLGDDVVLHPQDDVLAWPGERPGVPARERPTTTSDAVELVAAGVGVLVVPKSLARLHHRKDVTYRELTGAPSAPVGLVWATERTTPLVEELVGIVRGRTANSSRGRGTGAGVGAPAPEAGPGSGKTAKAAKGAPKGGAGKGAAKGGSKGAKGGGGKGAGASSVDAARRGAAARRAAAGKRARRREG